MAVHPFNPSTWEQRQGELCEFKASLVYKESSRLARAVTQRNPISKSKNKQKGKERKKEKKKERKKE